MIRSIILAAVCCLSTVGLFAQDSYSIKGKVGKVDAPAMIYLSYYENGQQVTDSVQVKKGKFMFKGQLETPVAANLQLRHEGPASEDRASTEYLYFYLENSDITVNSKDSLKRAIVKGSTSHDNNQRLTAMRKPYKQSADSLVRVYHSLTPEERKDSTFIKSASAVMQRTQAGYDSVSRVFIAQNAYSQIALAAFSEIELGYNFNPDTAAARFAHFPESLRSSAMGKKLQSKIKIGQNTNIGATAIDFVQQDTLGNSVKLSDFRGHYVLLDFWASWCVPCRAENPVMLKAYNKFKDKDFTILGVSLDDQATRRAWLNAIKVDGLPWTQVSELKGFKSEAAVQYGVSAIPSNFLIDPQGKIVARNLRGEELDKKLAEILGEE